MTKYANNSGNYYLEGLFFERQGADKSSVVYTLKDQDHMGYPSLYRLYMESEDLLEWNFTQEHLGGWSHWEKLTKTSWFKPYIERWRKELELKLSTRYLRNIQEEALSENRGALSANKFLLERGWDKDKQTNRRGRPSKDEILKEARTQAEQQNMIREDFERLSPAPKEVN